MTRRILTNSVVISVAAGLCFMPGAAMAQQRAPAPATPAAQAAPVPKPATKTPYVPPKTPWGEPDLQGTWPLTHLISTNFQRSPQYGDRRFLTDQEFAAAQTSASQRAVVMSSGFSSRICLPAEAARCASSRWLAGGVRIAGLGGRAACR